MKKHIHFGKSSKGSLDANLIIDSLNIKKNSVVVDAGCGEGYISKLISEKAKVYAYDIHKESLDLFEGAGIIKAQCDITKTMPNMDKTVDAVLTVNVMHGFEKSEIENFFKECKRILKSKGKLGIVEFKKVETGFGPPVGIRLSGEDLCKFIKGLVSIKKIGGLMSV